MSEQDHDTGSDDRSFLQRWSQLKSAARRDAAQVPEDAGTPSTARRDAAPEATALDAGAPPLPDLEQLDQDADYSAFLAPGVDPLLRRKALRKLFHSPKFNVCDGLDDYCDDFTRYAALGDIVTADMKHQIERAARRALEQLESERRAPAPAAVMPAVAAADADGGTSPTATERASDDGESSPA